MPPDSVAAVVEAAERALRAARGPDGAPVVTATWRVPGGRDAPLDSLGRGGPLGGQLYYETAPGYAWDPDPAGPAAADAPASAEHGFPSTAADMHTAFCAEGPAFAARRIGPAAARDVAPTVAAWLGVPAPAQATGRSRLEALLGRPRPR